MDLVSTRVDFIVHKNTVPIHLLVFTDSFEYFPVLKLYLGTSAVGTEGLPMLT